MEPLIPNAQADLATEWNTSSFREMCHIHPSAEAVRWWRAVPNPGINPVTGGLPWGTSDQKWIRIEETLGAPYRALIQGAQARAKYLPQGVLMDGDIIVTSMPDELPLSMHDWVCPIGKPNQSGTGPLTARTFVYKDLIVRGAATVPISGTVSSSGITVTGAGTAFTTELQVGDMLKSISQSRIVTAINSDTSLTVDAAPSPAWAASSAQRGIDRFIHWPAAMIEDVRTASTVYGEISYAISSDGQELRWTDPVNAPAPGVTYSVTWRYFPIYQIIVDAAFMRRQVRGVGLPQRVVARLLTQITITK
jgi:hypothetical protein